MVPPLYQPVLRALHSRPTLILPQVSNQSLGDYLKASIFTPANLTGAVFVPGTGGSLVENLVNNPGYVSLFTASAGACHCTCRGVQRWSGWRISKLGLDGLSPCSPAWRACLRSHCPSLLSARLQAPHHFTSA